MTIINLYKLSLFVTVVVIALFAQPIEISAVDFAISLSLFILFSIFYDRLRVSLKEGDTDLEYAINYGLSIALFTGPIGIIIYEIVFRVLTHFLNKLRDTEYNKPLKFTFYNISTFTSANIVAYYLYIWLWPYFMDLPFGFWLLFALLVLVTNFLSDSIILIYFFLIKEIRTFKAVLEFYKHWNFLDLGKTGLINGLLFIFLINGQWEYLVGVFMLNYFVSRSIISKTQNIRDRDERDKFKEMAYRDSLTGANNRAYMDRMMEELGGKGETFGIVVADIDHFKVINDTYNHAVGDEVLRHFTKFLKSHIQEDDFVFRSGGEEFTLFLKNRSFDETYELLETIKQELEDSFVMLDFNGEEKRIIYTSSFGFYYKHFSDHSAIEKGYIYADNLLFQSKRLGRNRITAENGM
jgi:diguanylate cyclase (GGDEF)-like protein